MNLLQKNNIISSRDSVCLLQFLPHGFKLDQSQLKVIKRLELIASYFNKKPIILYLLTKFFDKYTKKGIYLYGGVGRGKTMLIRAFCKRLGADAHMVHYQDFMQSLHIIIHKLQTNIINYVVEDFIKNYAHHIKILCIDEFEIKDISDAMIMIRLINEFIKRKILICVTTNSAPQNLYMDGLQRESFLPFIHQIQAEFEILHLDNHYDYRLESFIANNHTRLFYPLNKQNNDIMKRIILKKTHNQNLEQTNIEIFGRTLSFLRTYKQTLVSNFHELFVRELSYIDYVNICQKFTTIIVENISIIESNETDIAIRFINFIDNAYFYKVLLFTSLETSPDKLYPNGKRLEEFQRTISRLHEMNNESYMSGKNEF